MKVGELFAEMGIDIDPLRRGLDQARATSRGHAQAMERDLDGVNGAMARVAAAQRRTEQAAIGLRQAQRQLTAEQQRYAAVLASTKSSEADRAGALDRLRAAELRVADATDRHTSSLNVNHRAIARQSTDVDSSSDVLDKLRSRLDGSSRSGSVFSNVMGMVKWPAIIAGANLFAGAITAVGGALLGAVAAIGPLSGLVATLPSLFATAGQAMGTVTLATFGMADAFKASADASTAAGAAAVDTAADERALAAAQRQVLIAQEALTAARESARRGLMSLRDQVKQGELDERRATMALRDARREAEKAFEADKPREYREALLAVDQAELDLSRIRRDNRLAADDLAEAERNGIKNAPEVVAARRNIADAQLAVKDATRQLREAHTAGAPVVDKYAEALGKLPPAARAFVERVVAMRPELEKLRAIAAENLFGPMLGQVNRVRELFPLAESAVAATASVLGRLANQAANMVLAPGFQRDLEAMAGDNVRLLDRLGTAGLVVADGFRHVVMAARPLVRWLGDVAVKIAEAFRSWAQNGRESGRLAEFFNRTRRVAEQLGPAIANVGTTLVNIGKAVAPVAGDMLGSFRRMTERWAEFTGSVKGQNAIAGFFAESRPLLRQLGLLIKDVLSGFADMARNSGVANIVKLIRRELLPVFFDLGRSATGKLAPALVELARNWLELFTVFGTETGVLRGFLDMFNRMLGMVNQLLTDHPGLAKVLVTFSAFGGALNALGVGKLFGVVAATRQYMLLQQTLTAVHAMAAPAAGANAAATTGVGVASRVAAAGANVLRLAMLALPWVAIAAAIAAVVIIVVKNWDKIVDAAKKAFEWVKNILGNIGDWFKRVWKNITGTVGDALRWIRDAVSNAFGWVVDRVARLGSALWQAVVDTWNGVIGSIGDAIEWIFDGMNRFGRAIGNAINKIIGWFGRIPGWIWDRLKELPGILFDLGKKIITGLWEGAKDAAGGFLDWVGGLGQKIIDLKGPPAKDRTLLTPAGRYIMQGLREGMRGEVGGVFAEIDAVNKALEGVGGRRGRALGGMAAALPGARAAVQPDTVNVFVLDESTWRRKVGRAVRSNRLATMGV